MSESSTEQTVQAHTITVDERQLEAIVTAVVSKIIAEAVTDIRKGLGPLTERVETLNNTVMSVKNTQLATNQAIAELKNVNSKRSAVVYVGKTDPPTDLFGNVNSDK